jgi:cation-transporting ATPase I
MVTQHLRSVTSWITSPVTGLVRALTTPSVGRRLWSCDDRTYLEVRGIHQVSNAIAAREVEQRLDGLDGVSTVEVNAVQGRVAVRHDPSRISRAELARVIGEVEAAQGLNTAPVAAASVVDPANTEPLVRELAALATNLGGLGYWATTSLVFPLGRIPPLIPALVSLVDFTPRLHSEVESWLGRSAADTLFALGSAVSNSLAGSPIVLITDAVRRFCLHREASARQQAWCQWDAEWLAERPGAYRANPLDVGSRPVPLPDGPIEQVSTYSAVLAVASYAAVLLGTRNSARALAMLSAGVPKPARAGREAFTAQLATDLSAQGGLVLDPDLLDRLDRVDTIVLDDQALVTGRRVVDEVLALTPSIDSVELFQRAHEVIDIDLAHADPSRAARRSNRAGWAAMSWTDSPFDKKSGGNVNTEHPSELVTEARRRAREWSACGAAVFVLLRDSQPVGLVAIAAELDPLAEAMVAAAGRAGLVLVAETTTGLHRKLDADGAVDGGARLTSSVRVLQASGHVVAVISAHSRPALAAADVGIGIVDQSGTLPWGAHAMFPGLIEASVVLGAVPAARDNSRTSAILSVAGSSVGALFAALGPALGAGARAAFPVHLASLFAIATATWAGAGPARQPSPVPVERTPWHAMSPQAALDRLGSRPGGLNQQESQRRRAEQPTNGDEPEVSLARASVEELANPLTPALAGGAGLSASVGSITDAVIIAGVLAVNALIGGAQRLGTNRALRALRRTSAGQVMLHREGIARTASADELVPGDVIELHAGDTVPADCRLLEAAAVEVDESSLTGESALVTKEVAATAAASLGNRHSMLYQGSVMAAGQATGVVVATGDRTEMGRTARLTEQAPPPTGVQTRLKELTRQTLPVSIGAGLGLLGLDLLRGSPIDQAVGRAVSLTVAAVPEGLPFVATVAQLASARRLSARGALARNPSTIEALGRVNVLCFDKTGTLTEGRIRLRQVSDGQRAAGLDELDEHLRQVIAVAVRASPWQQNQVPHQTDRAVLRGARKAGVTPNEGLDEVHLLDELVFEPSRGYHAALWRCRTTHRLSVKGAPEVVLPRCARWRRAEGIHSLDDTARRQIEHEVNALARRGYRVLAVAERTASERSDLDESRLRDLEFCGLVALADPVRPTAAQSVGTLVRAGVEVIMLTGDHPSTAESIAVELGVLNGRRVVTGPELDQMDDEQLGAALPNISVFARVDPAQKARIVRQLRHVGRVVAVTGDGANDAPAIRLADVGIALGKKATQAARDAADVVVTDNRIETITDAIVEGRAMWSSVRDALSILLGGNLGEIAFTVGAGLFSGRQTLNTRQLLLVNLLTDVLPAMAVAVRPPPDATADQLLAEGPEASLGSALTRDIYLRAAATAGAAAAAWLLARPASLPGQSSTTALVALVGAQLGQTIAVRGRTPLVVRAVLGSGALLAIIVQVPGVSHFFGCRPLLPHQWGIALGSAGVATLAALLWQWANQPTAASSTTEARTESGR